jgi:general secretion pathway protein G
MEGAVPPGDDVPKDPWGNPFRYRASGDDLHNKDSFDLWSAGPDGKDGTDDDIKNWR